MPELPEVEVLVRHLASCLVGRRVHAVRMADRRTLRPGNPARFGKVLTGARFESVRRRGKYLIFRIRKAGCSRLFLAHLGMTGRLYLARVRKVHSPRATVIIGLGREGLVFEDVRRFGRMTLDLSALERLGPEPLSAEFTVEGLRQALARSRQPIKVKLLDQSVVAGIGNIYASEALFLARINPRTPSWQLDLRALKRLRSAIRRVVAHAIRYGSTLPLDFGGSRGTDGLFYYGTSSQHCGRYEERLRVYDRQGEPCRRCRSRRIQKISQAGRSTYFCPLCQA